MGDVVALHGSDNLPEMDLDLVADLARYDEGLMSEQSIKTKYRERFDDAMWDSFGDNTALIKAVDTEKARRVRDGSCAREKAQQLFAGAPAVLGTILHGDVSPRHKIESVRELRTIAANGPEIAPAESRFLIQINMGADTEIYSKSLKADPTDEDPYHPTPPEILAAIAANKKDGDDGGHI